MLNVNCGNCGLSYAAHTAPHMACPDLSGRHWSSAPVKTIATDIVNPILKAENMPTPTPPHAHITIAKVDLHGLVVIPPVPTRYRISNLTGATIGDPAVYVDLAHMTRDSVVRIAEATYAAVLAAWDAQVAKHKEMNL